MTLPSRWISDRSAGFAAFLALAAFIFSTGAAEIAPDSFALINDRDWVTAPSAANLSPQEAFRENGDGATAWASTTDLHGTELATCYATSHADRLRRVSGLYLHAFADDPAAQSENPRAIVRHSSQMMRRTAFAMAALICNRLQVPL